jgi:hypothetical protein
VIGRSRMGPPGRTYRWLVAAPSRRLSDLASVRFSASFRRVSMASRKPHNPSPAESNPLNRQVYVLAPSRNTAHPRDPVFYNPLIRRCNRRIRPCPRGPPRRRDPKPPGWGTCPGSGAGSRSRDAKPALGLGIGGPEAVGGARSDRSGRSEATVSRSGLVSHARERGRSG